MSVRPVTYYEVVCDEPDCGATTSDLGGEYSAWSEGDGALEEWREAGCVILEDGRTFCEKHSNDKCCDHCGQWRMTVDDGDGDRICEACDLIRHEKRIEA